MARTFVQRMIDAAKLEPAAYEEVEHDTGATGAAAGVVVLASIASGIGALSYGGIGMLIGGMIAALLGWVVWAAVIYIIGAKLLPEAGTEADMGQLLRTLGFAQSPGLLRVFGIIPFVGGLIYLIVAIWTICTTVVAVRQALDYDSTGRAVGVVILGFLFNLLISAVFFWLFGIGGSGAGTATPY